MASTELSPFTDFCFLFLSIVLEGAPFILLGTLISGFIDAYLPPGLIDRWLPKNKPLAVILSGLLGAIFPVCECAIVPVIRRLIRKGLPVSCAITYMLSAPIINPIVVISTMNAFNSSVGKFSIREKVDAPVVHGALYVTCTRLLVAFIITGGGRHDYSENQKPFHSAPGNVCLMSHPNPAVMMVMTTDMIMIHLIAWCWRCVRLCGISWRRRCILRSALLSLLFLKLTSLRTW